jgi:uncharacterized RDD family membrane protein YckC
MSQPTGEPQGGPPAWQQAPQQPASPPPPQSWQQAPQQPVPPGPPPSQAPSWAANVTSTAPTPGPAGYVYGDIPNRVVAIIIDVIAMFVVYFLIGLVAIAILGTNSVANTASLLVGNILSYVLWAVYFIYLWVARRGTFGMTLLGMQVGSERDGATLTYDQASVRFAVLFGPQIVVGIITALVPSLQWLSWVSFIWFFVVLYTMGTSPTKQGIHDRYAHSMVVKAARRAA